jgi:hypothetical protein
MKNAIKKPSKPTASKSKAPREFFYSIFSFTRLKDSKLLI